MAIVEASRARSLLNLGAGGLAGLLVVRPIVDDHRHPRGFQFRHVGGLDLAADQRAFVESAHQHGYPSCAATTSTKACPSRSSLAAPTPERLASVPRVVGFSSAISRSVLSWNTT